MNTALFLMGTVIVICVLTHKFTSHLKVPSLLFFIGLGMCFGENGIFRISFDDYALSEMICSACLIFVMFYGGFGTNIKEAKPVAVQSFLLSTLGVVLTAGMVGVFVHIALGAGWLESMLIGSVVSSTDAASVFNILRSKKLNLKDNTASLLELEPDVLYADGSDGQPAERSGNIGWNVAAQTDCDWCFVWTGIGKGDSLAVKQSFHRTGAGGNYPGVCGCNPCVYSAGTAWGKWIFERLPVRYFDGKLLSSRKTGSGTLFRRGYRCLPDDDFLPAWSAGYTGKAATGSPAIFADYVVHDTDCTSNIGAWYFASLQSQIGTDWSGVLGRVERSGFHRICYLCGHARGICSV